MASLGFKGPIKWTQQHLSENNCVQHNKQCQNAFQLNFDSLLKNNTNKVTSPAILRYGHWQTGSNIFLTGHMTGSGATTCKWEIRLL